MAEPHLILCGGARLTSRQSAWLRAPRINLTIGDGDNDVHVRVEHISKMLSADVPDVATDLLDIASYVYTADQAIRRGGPTEFEYGDRRRRRFRFEIPVRCLDVWRTQAIVEGLAQTLSFLSDDDYEFSFCRAKAPRARSGYFPHCPVEGGDGQFEEVMLLSDGLNLGSIQTLAQNSPDVIESADAVALVRQGALLLDVRTPSEFEAGHIVEAVNIPLVTLTATPVQGIPADRKVPVVAICGVGKRSLNAMLLLKAQGYESIKSIRGGMQAWTAEQRPLQIAEK